MTPVIWIILFMLVPVAFPDSLTNFVRSRFHLNVMRGTPGEPCVRGFLRIIGGSMLFGVVVGLFGGCVAMAVWLLHSHLLSQ
jgi:hypothetical protein